MNSVLFWTSCIVGFIIVMILYIQNKAQNVEGFITEGTAPSFYEGPYVPESISKLIYMYLSSFSDLTSDGMTPVYQSGGSALWRDLKDGKEYFSIIGSTLPTSLRNPPNYGLSMMNNRLVGPPSENFAYPNSGYVLPSISICFFGRWKTVDLQSPLVLYRMFCETPNDISIIFTPIPNDSSNVKLTIVLGSVSQSYDWIVPKTTILTQSIGAVYAFIYNKEENTLTCSIGTTNLGTVNLAEKPTIKLSNSPIEIATSANWDFQLQAVLLCRGIVTPTDITATTDYFVNLANGKVQEVTQLQQQATEVKQNLETCNSKLPRLLAQIENLQGEVMYNETEMKDLRKKLEREKLACMKAASGDTKFNWLIKGGKCPDVRSAPKGVHEFPHLIQKVTVGLQNEPQISKDTTTVIAPPTPTTTFKHTIQPIGSAEHSSWLSKWVPLVK